MEEDIKEKRKKWDKTYREKHPERVKESFKKYSKTENGKAKIKQWRKDNPEKILESNRKYVKKNPEIIKKKFKRYYNTDKGTVNMLRKHDARRLGTRQSVLTLEVIQMINKRDKECVYCGCELKENINHDHINPFRPFSKYNIVRACSDCNKDKSRADMIQWMNFKGYKISQKLLDLYKKAYE